MANPQDWGEIPDVGPVQQESPSIFSRIGQQAANAPANLLNDLMRLQYNVGFRTGDQTKPDEVPLPYDIPEPKTGGEFAVDIGTNVAESLPLFLTGEGAGAGAARLTRAGPLLARMLKVGGGFGLQGLTESPEHAAVEGGLGAGLGAAEMAPGAYKIPAALALGGATYLERKLAGASDKQSAIMGVVNTLLPFFGGRVKRPKVDEAVPFVGPMLEEGFGPRPLAPDVTPGFGKNIGLTNPTSLDMFNPLKLTREGPPPPEGSIVRNPIYSEGEALTIANARQEAAAQPVKPFLKLENGNQPELGFFKPNGEAVAPGNVRTQPTTEQPFLNLGAPAGSLVRDPIMTMLEMRRGKGIQPPPGSLIREPAISMGEARKVVAARTPIEGRVIPFEQPTTSIVESIRTPEGETMHKPQIEGPHVVSTAVKQGDKYLVGSKWNEAHEGIGVRHGLDEVKQSDRGFIVQNAKGEQSFVSRSEAGPMAEKAGQLQNPMGEKGLQSADLKKAESKVAPKRVLLSSVLHESNEELVKKAAKKLGLEYNGVQDNAGRDPNQLYFSLTTPGRETTISIESGETFKDLKNKVIAKNAEYDLSEAKATEAKKVATLQPAGPKPGSAAAEASLTSSPETIALPQGLKVGDVASFVYEGERTVGEILGPGEIEGTVKVRTKDGELDRPIAHLSLPGVRTETTTPVKSVGGSAELEKLGTEPQQGFTKVGGGKMKLSNFGEHGGISTEAALALGKYVAAPLVGGIAGIAIDPQHKAASGIEGAIIAGVIAHFGVKGVKLLETGKLLESGVPKGQLLTTLKKTIKDDAYEGVKAITGNEVLARNAAKDWGLSDNWEKLAKWMNKNARTSLFLTRFKDKAGGIAEDLALSLNAALNGLRREKDITKHFDVLDAYFRGDPNMSFATLQHNTSSTIASLAKNAADARDQLQEILIEGVGGGKLQTAIRKSLGSYLSTTYRIFHEPKYNPTDAQIQKAAISMDKMFPNYTTPERMVLIKQYLQEVKANRSMYGGAITGLKGESLGTILTRSESLTPEFKEMLGLYENPIERMTFTGMKLVTGASSAEFFNEVARGVKPNGLKFAYTVEELRAQKSLLQNVMTNHSDPDTRMLAKIKFEELDSYIPNLSGKSSGRLDNMWMDAKTHDQLSNFDTATRMFKSQLMQGIAGATNAIKYGKVVLSPFQLMRQVIQMPLLGMISKTFPTDWASSYKLLFSKSSADIAEIARLRRLGILTGDPIGGELRKDAKAMLEGTLDAMLSQRLRSGLHQWEKLWRSSDLAVRISAFRRQEQKFLEAGFSAEEAANKAIDFTNRYTMNYGAVPSIIAKGRQLPFINQYLSWTYETLRITKNLVEDAKQGNVHAIGVLSTMATAPFILQSVSESQLSEKDNKDWQIFKKLSPTYNRNNFQFVSGRNSDGSFRYYDYTPLVIHDQLFRMIRGVMSGDTQAVLSSNPVLGWENTPALNVLTMTMGMKGYEGERLNTWSDKANAIRKEVLPSLLGTEFDRAARALTENESGHLGITNLRTGSTNSMADILQTLFTSVRPYTAKVEYLQHNAEAEVHDRIRSQQRAVRQILYSNASAQVKQNAQDNYEISVKEILKAYYHQMGLNEHQPTSVSQ